jgi:hypothetical protein
MYKELYSAKSFQDIADILNKNPSKYISAWKEIQDVLKAMTELDGGVYCEYDLAEDPDINPDVWEKVLNYNPDDTSKTLLAYKQINAAKGEVFVMYGDTDLSLNGKDEYGVEIWPMKMIKLRCPHQ